jgi:peptidoglycan hydrolase-like protein with peptidoglycan-binding domain
MNGLYGKDVNQLVALLQEKYYLRKDFSTTQSNFFLFDDEVEAAVIQFQRDAKIKDNGIMDLANTKALRSWDAENSTKALGIRELKINDRGTDVLELIELLNKAGFPPDPEKLEGDKYNEEVEKAVKAFQMSIVSGIADTETITQLKSASK